MENKFTIDTSAVAEYIKGIETLVCSVSTAKRNGKITNTLTRVKKDGYGKCLESFCNSINEKLKNHIIGTVELDYVFDGDADKPNTLMLVETIREIRYIGEITYFVPELIDGTWVYKKSDKSEEVGGK